MTDHPSPEALDRYLRGRQAAEDAAEAERITAHLLDEGCARCLFAARERIAGAEPELRESIHRVADRERFSDEERVAGLATLLLQAERRRTVLEAERALAPQLLRELERRPPATRRDLVRTVPRYQLLALAEHLCQEAREEGFRDVVRALELAELAVEVSDTLDPGVYAAVTTVDEQAHARACLGNARRIASDLFGAERAFQESLLLLKEGNPGSPVQADVWSLLGSLRVDQGRYLEARELLKPALELYRDFHLREEEAKVLLQLADADGYSGNAERAVTILVGAVRLLDGLEPSRLHLQAHHNLADWMVDAGQALEALAYYEKARALYDEHCTEPSLRLRRRWLEGRIYAGMGDLGLARQALDEVRATAAEGELSYEVAMVSLELAIVELRRGNGDRVRELAEEMTPILRSHELHRHALAAISLVRHEARKQRATVAFLEETLHYLRRARNNPFLRFDPAPRAG